jgi:hypothetical protein
MIVPLMKLFRWLLPSAVVSLCACTVTPTPTAPSAVTTVDARLVADGFDADFFHAFVQNGYEAPNHLEPVRMLPGPFRLYLRTQDDAGRAIDQSTLASTERTLLDAAPIWSGDTFGVAEVQRGTGSRENMPGWITVKWSAAPDASRCGRSTVGVDGGFIELNVSGSCSCGMATRVYPRLVRHELGHAMGYYHTDQTSDVMYGQPVGAEACDLQPSERERRHAKFAHGEAH